MSYEIWRAWLAGKKPKIYLQPNADNEGYYRYPYGHKDPSGNGKWITDGYYPVALFLPSEDTEKLAGLIGAGNDIRDLSDDELLDEGFWSYCAGNPVSYEEYDAVANAGKPWSDSAQAQVERTQDDGKRAAENQEIAEDNEPKKPETLEEHRAAIKALIETAKATTEVTSDEQAAIEAGTMNMLAEARLAADKAGKVLYQPPYKVYDDLFKAWTPMVKAAKQAEDRLNNMILTWREKERNRLAAIAADQAAITQAELEANECAADRAIANGEEPPPPVVEPPPPPPVAPKRVKPTYVPAGHRKTVKEELKTFITITDEVKLCAFYRNNEELVAILTLLAERDIKRGVMPPGIETEERLA